MRKKIIKFITCNCFIFISFWSYGQDISPNVISSSGGTEIGTNLTIDWTLGEVITTTISGSTNTISQGFHQTNYILTSIKTNSISLFDVKVFPNPTSDYLNISIKSPVNSHYILSFVDLNGKELEKMNIILENQNILLDMSKYPAGNYFINLKSSSEEIQQTYKIQKIK